MRVIYKFNSLLVESMVTIMKRKLSCKILIVDAVNTLLLSRGRRSRDRMVVGFTTTYAISAYHH
jgi:hypothetical protein